MMKKLAALPLILMASAAAAHPGHDAALGGGAAHYMLSPLHGLGVIAVAVALYGVRSFLAKE